MNKKVLLAILVAVTVFATGFIIIKDLMTDEYAFYGDVWQDTVEEALKEEADQTSETLQTLTPKVVFETQYIDDIAIMTFLSKDETLVTVDFVTNEDGQYCVNGYTEERDLDSPTEFLLNGDPNQSILFPYNDYNSKVWGWCYSDANFTVNGITPFRKRHKFEAQGKERTIDFWTIDDVSATDDISIDYASN